MSTPQWAMDLVARVCDAAGVDEPEVTWRRSRRSIKSSGRYFVAESRLVVTAGTDRRDQKLVLLHELAHHLTPKAHHGAIFWTAAWNLYKRFGLSRYALTRETSYRAAAADAALALNLRGARKAAAKAADNRRSKARPRNVCPMPEEQASAHGYGTPHTHYVGTIHRFTLADGSFVDYWTEPR